MTDEIKDKIRNRLIELGINSNSDVDDIFKKWSEPHRYYHGLDHLTEIIDRIIKNDEWNDDKLFLLAVFHDVIYNPRIPVNLNWIEGEYNRYNNEQMSVYYYMGKMVRNCFPDVCATIMDTQSGDMKDSLSLNFIQQYDRYNLYYGSFSDILNKTMLLFKEEQFLDLKVWKKKQIDFLTKFIDFNRNIENVIEYIKNWEPKIGIYAGTFEPFHKGHKNILDKSEKIFDKVIIAKGVNSDKVKIGPVFYLGDIQELKYHQIEKFDGFLTTFINKLGYDVTLIRGLRNSTDLQYEMTQFQYLQDMKPDIKIVNIFCDKEFEHISSSAIRNLISIGGEESVKKYLV